MTGHRVFAYPALAAVLLLGACGVQDSVVAGSADAGSVTSEVTPHAATVPHQLRELYGPLPEASSPALRVAVIDDGVNARHPALAGRVEAQLAVGPRATPGSHATQVAGLIVGHTEPGFAGGLAPFETRLVDIDVLDGAGPVSSAAIADGIRMAVDHKADIINISLALSRPDSGIEEALSYAKDAGVIAVASTRNDVVEDVSYPAAYESVLGIASLTEARQLAPLSTLTSADAGSYGHQIAVVSEGDADSTATGSSLAAAAATGMIARCPSNFVLELPERSARTTATIPLVTCPSES